jgi:hypothetical protein
MRLGVPSILAPGNAILAAVSSSERSDVPRTLLLELDLMLVCHQWIKILGDDDSSPSGECQHPEYFAQTFDNQCNSIREKYAGHWSPRLEVAFYTLQLQLYSFIISRKNPTTISMPSMSADWDITYAKALTAVVGLVSAVSQAEDSKEYWPVFAKYHVMLAACVSIYMAAIATDISSRTTLLTTSKNAISLLAEW